MSEQRDAYQRRRSGVGWIGVAIWLLLSSACGTARPSLPAITPAVTLHAPLAGNAHSPTPPTSTPNLRDGRWRPVAAGVEYMLLEATFNQRREWLTVVRVQPGQARFRVHYEPELPRRVRQWQRDTGAAVVVNGGFFDGQNRATALVIADGVAFGRSYRGFGGMFAVRNDGTLALFWLREQSYRPDPRIAHAVQGFPMLVVNGEVVNGIEDSGRRSRRTFVALDRAGNVLFGVTFFAQWTLTDLASYLVESPFDTWQAMNLDGGGSSGLWIQPPYDGVSMDSLDPVPAVIAVMPAG